MGEAALADFLRTQRLATDSAVKATLQKCAQLIRTWHGDSALHLNVMIVENKEVKKKKKRLCPARWLHRALPWHHGFYSN